MFSWKGNSQCEIFFVGGYARKSVYRNDCNFWHFIVIYPYPEKEKR